MAKGYIHCGLWYKLLQHVLKVLLACKTSTDITELYSVTFKEMFLCVSSASWIMSLNLFQSKIFVAELSCL